jgi:hypothetical protein
VHVKGIVLGGHDAGRVLAAMLQDHQAIIEQLVDRRGCDNPENSAHSLFPTQT